MCAKTKDPPSSNSFCHQKFKQQQTFGDVAGTTSITGAGSHFVFTLLSKLPYHFLGVLSSIILTLLINLMINMFSWF